MKYIQTRSGSYLRPQHFILMLYRYLSGVYQLGDVAGLSYVRGFLQGRGGAPLARILTVSGNGIGEPELWLAEHFPTAEVNTVSFRLLNTQFLQFLRHSSADEIEDAFEQFRRMIEGFGLLAEKFADPGLVPYWKQQAADLAQAAGAERLRVYSAQPDALPSTPQYDLIYMSHGGRYITAPAINALRATLQEDRWLAVLVPSHEGSRAVRRFANSELLGQAQEEFNRLLTQRGYPPMVPSSGSMDLCAVAAHMEEFQLRVPTPAINVLIGELLLSSLHEHIADRVLLETLNEATTSLKAADVPVIEELELYMIRGEGHV